MESQENVQLQTAFIQSILENAPVGIALVHGNRMVFRHANPRYRSMLPAPGQFIIGLEYHQVWAVEDQALGEAVIRQVMESGQPAFVDHVEQRFPDGSVHHFSLQIHPLHWGNQRGVLIFAEETTETGINQQLALRIAEASRQRADELDAMITAMAEAVIIFNASGQPERANPAAIDLYGFDPTGIDPKDLVEILGLRYPDGSPMADEEIPSGRALKREVIIDQRLLLVNTHGEERVVRASASPVFDGQTVRSVVTIWHDVTERERLLEMVEIEQSRLFTIIENAPEAILVADEEGRIVLANPATERLLGQPLPYGMDFESHRQLNLCYGDGTPYDPRNLPLTCSALDGERLTNVELLVRLPNGKTRILLTSSSPIVDRRGNLNGAVAILQDITQRKRAYEREAQRARELQALNHATTALLSTIELETLLEQIVDAAHSAIPSAEKGGLFLLSDTSQQLEVRKTFGCVEWDPLATLIQPYLKQTIENRRSLLLHDIEGASIRSAMIAPLMHHQSVPGALVLCDSNPNQFTDDDLRLLDSFAATATAALQNATLYAQVQRLATMDTLTELYNRRRFFELGELEIHRFRRFHKPLSAIMLDLDNFKDINDTYGHGIGDFVLHAVATRTRENIRVVDILGRYGGDEFAILLPDAELEEASDIAERIRQAVTVPIQTNRGEIHISISLGLTQATLEGNDLSSLLGRADAALLQAKQGGRDQVRRG